MTKLARYPNWLPFVGFREMFVDEHGTPAIGETPWVSDCFMVGWFGRGIIFFTTSVRPFDPDC